MPHNTLWAALAICLAALTSPAGARMCQKPDGTFTDQCSEADRAVEVRRGAVQTPGGAGATDGAGAEAEAGGAGPWCREFLALDQRARLSVLHMNNGFDAFNLSPSCIESELLPRLVEGCRAGYIDGIVQDRAIASAKKQCGRARW